MGSDGAHMGVSAGRALKSILGGEPQPEPGEMRNPVQMREWLEGCLEYTPTLMRDLADVDNDRAYDECARWYAKRLLRAALKDPSLLVKGEALDPYYALKERDPLFRQMVETEFGPSGFQWGWAVNAVRFCVELGPVGNPAIVTIGDDSDG